MQEVLKHLIKYWNKKVANNISFHKSINTIMNNNYAKKINLIIPPFPQDKITRQKGQIFISDPIKEESGEEELEVIIDVLESIYAMSPIITEYKGNQYRIWFNYDDLEYVDYVTYVNEMNKATNRGWLYNFVFECSINKLEKEKYEQ